MSDLAKHLDEMRPLLERYGDAAVFLAIFVEGIGIPAPGQSMLIAAAVLAAQGDLSIGAVLVAAALGAAAGTLLGWAFGRFGGRRFLAHFASPARLASVERAFARYGAAVVVLGRFVDGARQLNGIAAGALDMPLGAFLPLTAAGAVLWSAFWGLGAYWLDRHFAAVDAVYRRIGPAAGVAIAAAALAVVVWLVRERAGRASQT